MKYAVFFLLCCLALASAAPQWLTTWPGLYGGGLIAPGIAAPGTVVAGPTVLNGLTGFASAGRIIAPGVAGPVIL